MIVIVTMDMCILGLPTDCLQKVRTDMADNDTPLSSNLPYYDMDSDGHVTVAWTTLQPIPAGITSLLLPPAAPYVTPSTRI